MNRLLAFILFLCLLPIPTIGAQAQGTASVTLTPIADATVISKHRGTNYGNLAYFGSDTDPYTHGYTKFDLSAYGVPTKATLYYTVVDASGNGPALYTTDSGWDEYTVNYGNRPAYTSDSLGDLGAVSVGQVVSWDVTSVVTSGLVSFGVKPAAKDGTDFGSRESGTPPYLVLEYPSAETPTPVPPTETATPVPTNTAVPPTATSTDVPTATPTNTEVPTATETATDVPTATETATDVPTATETATDVPTATPTDTEVPTATATAVPTETATALPTATATDTEVPTATASATFAPTSTNTPIPPTATATAVPTSTATATSTPTATATATQVSANEIIVENGQSIQAALDRATAGQTIRIKGGSYALSATLVTKANGVTVTRYDDTPVIIDGRNVVEPVLSVIHADTFRSLTFKNSTGAYGDVIIVTGDGSVLEDITGSGANQSVINVKSTADQTRIDGCDLSDAATGVQISGTNVTVNACTFHDLTRMVNDSGDCSGAHGAQGVAINNSRGPVVVTNSIGINLKTASVCYGTDGAFVELYNAQNTLVQGNQSSGADVFVESNLDTSGNRIVDNISRNEPFLTLHQSNNMVISGNRSENPTANNYFGGSTSGLDYFGNTLSGSGRFYWINQPLAVGTFHDNTYVWTGSGTFGHANGIDYKSVTAWVTALETVSGPTATPAPTQAVTPTATPAVTATPTPTKTPMVAPTATATPTVTATPSGSATPTGSVVLMAAGDIACNSAPSTSGSTCHYGLTSNIIVDQNPDVVLLLGDIQYETGSQSDYAAYYTPTWGRFKAKTYSAAGGSHDAYGGGYYSSYFGTRAGEPQKNWYSFDVGAWHIIVLNSYCDTNGNCAAQQDWLAKDLAAHPNGCSLAAWHEPLYTSGTRHGNESRMDVFFDMLVNGGVEMVLSGHEHEYERIGPIGLTDNSDPNGAVYFVVGTGGKSLETAAPSMEPLSRSFQQSAFGVLKLTLSDGSANYAFVPEPGKTFTDSGTITCH